MFAGVLLDLSGVIYVGSDPLPGAIEIKVSGAATDDDCTDGTCTTLGTGAATIEKHVRP